MAQHFVEPDQQQMKAFGSLPPGVPFQMLNLVRLRDRADYPAGHAAGAEHLSGAEAYARYLAGASPLFSKLGGKMIWNGKPDTVLIGSPDDVWDLAMVVQYPSADAFVAQTKDPAYIAAAEHRTAAVLTQVAVRCEPVEQRGTLA